MRWGMVFRFGVLPGFSALTFFKILPSDWGAAMDWLTAADVWIINKAAYPSLFALSIGLFVGFALLPEMWGLAKVYLGWTGDPDPNTRMDKALDYIVNDSREVLKKPPAPYIDHQGRSITTVGTEHQDALRHLNECVIANKLTVFGLRGVNGFPGRFETSRREIPHTYWQTMTLHPLMARVETERFAQTINLPGTPKHELEYTGLMIDMAQLRRAMKPKSLLRRLWEWKQPRIKDAQ